MTQLGEFRCFDNIKMKKKQVVIQSNITSGNSSAGNCDILVVAHNKVNLLGRDVLQKLGNQLAQKQKEKKKLKRAMLSEMAIWNHDSDSEALVDIQYRSDTTSDRDSDNQRLANMQPSTSSKHEQKAKEAEEQQQDTRDKFSNIPNEGTNLALLRLTKSKRKHNVKPTQTALKERTNRPKEQPKNRHNSI